MSYIDYKLVTSSYMFCCMILLQFSVTEYCQFSQQACTNFMQTYLDSLISTHFFILTTNLHWWISSLIHRNWRSISPSVLRTSGDIASQFLWMSAWYSPISIIKNDSILSFSLFNLRFNGDLTSEGDLEWFPRTQDAVLLHRNGLIPNKRNPGSRLKFSCFLY